MRDFLLHLHWAWQLVVLFGVPIAALILAVWLHDLITPQQHPDPRTVPVERRRS